MKRTLTILALLASATITAAMASALTVTISPVQAQVANGKAAIAVTFSNSRKAAELFVLRITCGARP